MSCNVLVNWCVCVFFVCINVCACVWSKICEPEEMKQVTGLSIPHTSHCLATGDIMISTMGDENEHAKGWDSQPFYLLFAPVR